MTLSTSQVWSFVRGERQRLADDLADVPMHMWAAPSLCPGWDVHDVLAHLVDTATTTRLAFLARMIFARFDFDGDNAAGIRRERRSDPHDTVAALRAVIPLTRTAIAPLPTRLVEMIVHGEDIRRPLMKPADYAADAVEAALRYQVRTSVGMGGGRERVEGLRLVATDQRVLIGRGDDVRGRTIDLLMAVSGRRVDPDAFSGPGAARLRGTRCLQNRRKG